jgi:serine/alanine adding enzyme
MTYAIIQPDSRQWDLFVCSHTAGHALQSSAWGQLKGDFGWSPQIVAVAGSDGIAAGALLLVRRRAGLSAMYAPRGPLVSGNREVDQLLFMAIERLARAARAVFVRIEPNMLEDDPNAAQLHSDLQLQRYQPTAPMQPRSSVHLDLAPEPERLLANMSKGHRADIRRAARDGVQVHASAASELAAFYTILEQTSMRNQFGIHTQAYYQAVLEYFGDAAQIWLAEQQGVAQATALTVAWGRTALYLYSGSTEAGLRSGAQHAIQAEVIRWAQLRGCTCYDFWGVPDPFGVAAQEQDAEQRTQLEEQAKSDPLYGVYRFKKGFGGRVVRYLPAYDRILMPPLYALWKRIADRG